MWILQIRSDDDGLDSIYTSPFEISEDQKILFMDVLISTEDTELYKHDGGPFEIHRRNDGRTLACLWEV